MLVYAAPYFMHYLFSYQACRITQKEIGERSIGLIINLITNDAQRLDEVTDINCYLLINLVTFFYYNRVLTDTSIHIDLIHILFKILNNISHLACRQDHNV